MEESYHPYRVGGIEAGKGNKDAIINAIGHSILVLSTMAGTPLSKNFELQNSLPYGKIISDMVGLTIGINSFNSTLKREFQFEAAVPINSIPPNPLTGAPKDKNCLLETLKALPTDEEVEERKALSQLFSKKYNNSINFRSLSYKIETYNSYIEKLATDLDNAVKPTKYKDQKQYGIIRSTRLMKKPKDTGLLEEYLDVLNNGFANGFS